MSAVLALAEPRRIKATHRRRRKVTVGRFVQRYYDPQIGRFLSIDPMRTNVNNGGNFNRYWYANANPMTLTDPDGRCPNCLTGAIGGGVGFVVGTLVNAGAQYIQNGKVDISDALIAGGSAGLAGAAIGFNPALAANPGTIALISGVTNVGGSVASDMANGQPVNVTKAAIAGIAGAVAGPVGAKAGNALENVMGAKAASVFGEVAGAGAGEGGAAGLTVAGTSAVNAAQRVDTAAGQAKTQLNNAVQQVEKRIIDKMNPNTGE